MSVVAELTAVILLSTRNLLVGFILLVTVLLLAQIVRVTVSVGRTAWRSVFAVTAGAAPVEFDVLAGGDHIGVRLAYRQRRLALNGSIFDHVLNVFSAVAVSCRHYYRD